MTAERESSSEKEGSMKPGREGIHRVTPQSAERIQRELAGVPGVPSRKYKQNVPQAELDATLHAYVRCIGNQAATARTMHVHLNTVKYRLGLAKRNWGVPESNGMDLLLRAARAGYGHGDEDFDSARAFALWAMRRADAEGHYNALALRLWLSDALEDWTQLRVTQALTEAAA